MLVSAEHPKRRATAAEGTLDIDTTVNQVGGCAEGAEIGCNSSKPVRPSQVLHMVLRSLSRLVPDTAREFVDEEHSMHDRPGLVRVLDEVPLEERPSLVLVDSTCRTPQVAAALPTKLSRRLQRAPVNRWTGWPRSRSWRMSARAGGRPRLRYSCRTERGATGSAEGPPRRGARPGPLSQLLQRVAGRRRHGPRADRRQY